MIETKVELTKLYPLTEEECQNFLENKILCHSTLQTNQIYDPSKSYYFIDGVEIEEGDVYSLEELKNKAKKLGDLGKEEKEEFKKIAPHLLAQEPTIWLIHRVY